MAFNNGLKSNCIMDNFYLRWDGVNIYQLTGRWVNTVKREVRRAETWDTTLADYKLIDRNIKVREEVDIILGRIDQDTYDDLKAIFASDNIELRLGLGGSFFPVVLGTSTALYDPSRGPASNLFKFIYAQQDN